MGQAWLGSKQAFRQPEETQRTKTEVPTCSCCGTGYDLTPAEG